MTDESSGARKPREEGRKVAPGHESRRTEDVREVASIMVTDSDPERPEIPEPAPQLRR